MTEAQQKEAVRLILLHILDHFILDDSLVVHGHLKLPRGNMPEGFHWPAAFWNGLCWESDEMWRDAYPFDPLHDFDDAWQVLKAIEQQAELHSALAHHLEVRGVDRDGFDTFSMSLEQLASLTPEKISVAALRCLQAHEDIRKFCTELDTGA